MEGRQNLPAAVQEHQAEVEALRAFYAAELAAVEHGETCLVCLTGHNCADGEALDTAAYAALNAARSRPEEPCHGDVWIECAAGSDLRERGAE